MKKDTENHYLINIGCCTVPVQLRRNKHARRLILRANPGFAKYEGGIIVTLPEGATVQEALAWTSSKGVWIKRQLDKLPDRVPFADGAVIPIRGVDHIIKHRPKAQRGVWQTDNTICVSGRKEHLARRVGDWLKKEARTHILKTAHYKALQLGRDFGRVTIRDTKSRWGSCTANGNLNFSWRLILTPDFVFDYVVSHEVAHLCEHNHGSEFWRLVHSLTSEPERACAWLNSSGMALHCYG